MSIQSETYSPIHMRAEKDAWTKWVIATIVLGIISFCLLYAVAPLAYWAREQKMTASTAAIAFDYLTHVPDPQYVLHVHSTVWMHHWMSGLTVTAGPLLISLFISAMFYAACPYEPFEKTHGNTRWATDKDIRKMEKRRQIGIRGGFLGVLGKWTNGQYIRLVETISVACSAPPGTGKTAALVVPSIVSSPNVSMIVNDPKPELAIMTSGYRSLLSHTFILDWSKTDKPEKGEFYPRFNFLSSQLVPPAGTAERDTYLDSVAKILIPDNAKGGDTYFTDAGRDALTGFMHYLVSHVNDAKSIQGIPPQWHGYEASFPMLVDWFANAQYEAEKLAESRNNAAKEQNKMADADGMKIFLGGIVDQIKANNYSNRAFLSLGKLVTMADKQRDGVFGTMNQALLPFQNKAVMERTSACDFTPADLRGMKDPETGEMLPVTLYICVNQAEAKAFASITCLLYEVMSREFISYGPKEVDRRGRRMGPYPICFMMDEFAKLPKSEAVLEGPDLGRSKKVSYWLFFQARSQIIKTYSKEDGTTIDSTCGVSIVLSQNDAETAQHYQKLAGKITIQKMSYSRNAGFSKSANPWAQNESISSEGVDFLRLEDITGMEPGTHLIFPQNFLHRIIKVKSPFFFEDKEMASKVFDMRKQKGPAPAAPLPHHIRVARMKEWISRMTANQEAERIHQESALAEIAASPVEETAANA